MNSACVDLTLWKLRGSEIPASYFPFYYSIMGPFTRVNVRKFVPTTKCFVPSYS